jgi:hypothetical protein
MLGVDSDSPLRLVIKLWGNGVILLLYSQFDSFGKMVRTFQHTRQREICVVASQSGGLESWLVFASFSYSQFQESESQEITVEMNQVQRSIHSPA